MRMKNWELRGTEPVDYEVLQESALAVAQATMYKALKRSGLKRSEVAEKMGRPRSFITKMLRGNHNLTIKTFARALAACGFEVSFALQPIQWGWVAQEQNPNVACSSVPACGGQFNGDIRASIEVPLVGACAP